MPANSSWQVTTRVPVSEITMKRALDDRSRTEEETYPLAPPTSPQLGKREAAGTAILEGIVDLWQDSIIRTHSVRHTKRSAEDNRHSSRLIGLECMLLFGRGQKYYDVTSDIRCTHLCGSWDDAGQRFCLRQ